VKESDQFKKIAEGLAKRVDSAAITPGYISMSDRDIDRLKERLAKRLRDTMMFCIEQYGGKSPATIKSLAESSEEQEFGLMLEIETYFADRFEVMQKAGDQKTEAVGLENEKGGTIQ